MSVPVFKLPTEFGIFDLRILTDVYCTIASLEDRPVSINRTRYVGAAHFRFKEGRWECRANHIYKSGIEKYSAYQMTRAAREKFFGVIQPAIERWFAEHRQEVNEVMRAVIESQLKARKAALDRALSNAEDLNSEVRKLQERLDALENQEPVAPEEGECDWCGNLLDPAQTVCRFL